MKPGQHVWTVCMLAGCLQELHDAHFWRHMPEPLMCCAAIPVTQSGGSWQRNTSRFLKPLMQASIRSGAAEVLANTLWNRALHNINFNHGDWLSPSCYKHGKPELCEDSCSSLPTAQCQINQAILLYRWTMHNGMPFSAGSLFEAYCQWAGSPGSRLNISCADAIPMPDSVNVQSSAA